MHRFKKYIIKPWNSTAIDSQDALPPFVWEHLLDVYCTLGCTLFSALFGAFSHLYYDIGGWVTAVGFIGALFWMSKIKPWRDNYRSAIFIVASYFFGSTIGPAINMIFEVDQSVIIKIIMGGLVFCTCHYGACFLNEERYIIYAVGEFTAPIFITAWMIIYESYPGLLAHSLYIVFLPVPWYVAVLVLEFCRNTLQLWLNFPIHLTWIAILCYYFDYSFQDLVLVYILMLAFISHMKIFCQEAVYIAAYHANECYYVDTTITFFTEFVARTMSYITHTVSCALFEIWWFLRRPAINDHANDLA